MMSKNVQCVPNEQELFPSVSSIPNLEVENDAAMLFLLP